MPFKIEIIYVERWYSFKQTDKSLISKIQIFHLSSYFSVGFNMCQNEVANNMKVYALANDIFPYIWQYFVRCWAFIFLSERTPTVSISFTVFFRHENVMCFFCVCVKNEKLLNRKKQHQPREKKYTGKKPLPNGLSQTLLITIINAHFLNNGLFKVIFFSLSTSVFCVPFIRFCIGINNLLWIDKVHNPWLIRVHFSECMCDYALRKKNQAEMRAFLSIFLRYSFV